MWDSSPGHDPLSGEYTDSEPYLGEAIVPIGRNGAGKLISGSISVGSSKLTVGCARTVDDSAFFYCENNATIRKSCDPSGCTGTAP